MYNKKWLKNYSTKAFEDKYTYQGNDLGLTICKDHLCFKLWSPYALRVNLNIYETGDYNKNDLITSFEMVKEEKGVFTGKTSKDYVGKYYTYTVYFEDEQVNEFCDPYARSGGINGKRGMIINLKETNPKGWDKDVNPNKDLDVCDTVIYELHIRDFSADIRSGIKNTGKYLGLTESGTSLDGKGDISTGIDYIKELGVTHIHFLPIYDYGFLDESEAYNRDKYNWGYDPVNYNMPEGSYCTNPRDGMCRVKELKEMIKSLHDNGISVIMDVVYNHTFDEEFPFNKAVPGYFYRIDKNGNYSNGSACGNDTASERSMVSKFIVDSVEYWAKEYHIDGFRFDLVGLIDVETINRIQEKVDALDRGIFLYGEGWMLDTKPTKRGVVLTNQKNINHLNDFAMFNDGLRDALKGSVFDKKEKGYISGNKKYTKEVRKSVTGLPKWSRRPADVVNYTSCHDNYTLYDKIQMGNPDITRENAIKENKLAAAIVTLSEGILLLHAGEEILREKINDKGEYVSDSVWSSDDVNEIKWENLLKNDVKEVYDYYKGLIAFRKAHPSIRFHNKNDVDKNIEFIDDNDNYLIAYTIKEGKNNIVIAYNSSKRAKNMKLNVDKLLIYVNEKKAGTDVIESISSNNGVVKVPACSCLVGIYKNK